MTWTGFAKFRRKFDGIVSLKRSYAMWPQVGDVPEDDRTVMTREELVQDLRYKSGNHIERFTIELLFRIVRNEDQTMSKEEIDMLKQQYLYKDCNTREFEQRKRLYSILKKTLIYIGIVDKHVQVLADNKGDSAMREQTQIKGLKWVFKSPNENEADLTQPDHFKFDESDYFTKRKNEFVIEFKKEPLKTLTHSFDNSGFAMFKGRNWRFFM